MDPVLVPTAGEELELDGRQQWRVGEITLIPDVPIDNGLCFIALNIGRINENQVVVSTSGRWA
jgi:hypothetical protein